MRMQELYVKDTFGLKTLDKKGAVKLLSCEAEHMRLSRECWEPIVKTYTGGNLVWYFFLSLTFGPLDTALVNFCILCFVYLWWVVYFSSEVAITGRELTETFAHSIFILSLCFVRVMIWYDNQATFSSCSSFFAYRLLPLSVRSLMSVSKVSLDRCRLHQKQGAMRHIKGQCVDCSSNIRYTSTPEDAQIY